MCVFGMTFILFLVQLFCCVETLTAFARPGPGKGNQQSSGMNSAKLKAFRIIMAIVVSAALNYLPLYSFTCFVRSWMVRSQSQEDILILA